MKRNVLRLITLTTVMAALPPICYAKTVLQAAVISPIPVDVLAPKPVPTTTDVIATFFGNNVILGTGINFETKKPVVLNPLTGEEVAPCGSVDGRGNCMTTIKTDNSELAAAIKNSGKIIEGTINKDGKDIAASFIVSVTALYKGSNCITYISAGSQYENCTTLQKDCAFLLPLSQYGNETETKRKNVRKVCGAINPNNGNPESPAPSGVNLWKLNWRKADCSNLKLRYAPISPTVPPAPANGSGEPAVTYSSTYWKYIRASCTLP